MTIVSNKNGEIQTILHCRMCDSQKLTDFLDLEHSPPSDRFLKEEELHTGEAHYPLKVLLCDECGFIQLRHVVSPVILYQINYPYEANITKRGKEHFYKMAEEVCKKFNLPKSSFVIDIGSNVGVLLSGFKIQGMRVLGVDPAKNIAEIANANGIETIPEFFGCEVVPQIVKSKGKADIITATNVFAHIGNLNDFMKAIDMQLSERGVFVFEAPYFVDLFNHLEYDTIYHEHLGYLSIKPLVKFFNKHEMELFDVERVTIHGGSIRVFVGRKGVYQVSDNVNKLLTLEQETGIYNLESLRNFSKKVSQHRHDLISLLVDLKKQGKKIVGVSAPAKGNTLLNYCKIGTQYLDYLTEKSNLKIGTYSPGMHIPVVSDNRLLKDKPDYALLLAWNFADEIIKNNQEYVKQGGKFIIPIPEPKIV